MAGDGRRDGDGRPDLGAEYRSAVEAARSTFEAFLRRRPPTSAAAGEPLDDDVVDEVRQGAAANDGFRFDDLRRTMRRSLDLYLELAERFLDSSSRSFESALRDRRVGISGTEAAATNAVHLSGAVGARASSRVWVHNRTDRPIVAAAFRCTDLWSSRGDVIGGRSVHVDPATVTSLAAGESTSSTIVIDVEPGAVPATYYGHVMLEGQDDVAVPLRVDVRPAVAPP